VGKILETDKRYCPFEIISLEKDYRTEISYDSGMGELSVTMGGKIDRIDRLENAYRVLDYKTGSGKMFFSSVDELFEPGKKNRNRAAFQTFLYARLFISNGLGRDLPVVPGVYLVREIFGQEFSYHFSMGTSRKNTPILDYSVLDMEFSNRLEELIAEIFDESTPFLQTTEEETCRNCLYKGICRR
jgi:hypothetical protein